VKITMIQYGERVREVGLEREQTKESRIVENVCRKDASKGCVERIHGKIVINGGIEGLKNDLLLMIF
jgi:hypothetical protein